MRIHITRSHFSSLLIGGCDAGGEESSVGLNGPGWWTPYDGGKSTLSPGKFVVIFTNQVENDEWGEEEGEFLYAVALDRTFDTYAFNNPGGRTKKFLVSPHLNVRWGGNPIDLLNSAFRALYEDVEGWEEIPSQDVPDHVRKVLEKGLDILLGLFGQGGDFFEV